MASIINWHERMTEDLRLAGLSERTETAYLRAVRQLAAFHDGRTPQELSEQDVRRYLVWLRGEKRAAAGTLKIAFNGIRFFYRHSSPRDWAVLKAFRIAKERRLPTVATHDEVQRIMAAVRQLRFRAYFWTVYSCGLRLTEALWLETGDVDSGRMPQGPNRCRRRRCKEHSGGCWSS